MLLKNKAPSNKSKGDDSKSLKISPKRSKNINLLKKYNTKKKDVIGLVETCIKNKVSVQSNDMIGVVDDESVGGSFVKIELGESSKPAISSTEDVIPSEQEPAIYYKQEPLINTFSDALSALDDIQTSDLRNKKNITSSLSVKKLDKAPKKPKAKILKTPKVNRLESIDKESSSNSKINNSIVDEDNVDDHAVGSDIRFPLGSIVWAKVSGFCWWPAIVDDDPDLGTYYWRNENSDIVSHYHVTFLDDDVSRFWVLPKHIKAFVANSENSSSNVKACKKTHQKMINKAIEAAEKCLHLDSQSRIGQYGFAVRFTGKTNKWARAEIKKQQKLRENDNFESLDLITSIIEAKTDQINTDINRQQVPEKLPKARDKKKREKLEIIKLVKKKTEE